MIALYAIAALLGVWGLWWIWDAIVTFVKVRVFGRPQQSASHYIKAWVKNRVWARALMAFMLASVSVLLILHLAVQVI
jgi:hypothetical protein